MRQKKKVDPSEVSTTILLGSYIKPFKNTNRFKYRIQKKYKIR